ncbi:hypothetical protein L226DRAFT_475998 [Lentinus tigrinus ALCF2SS1-7]|uniref:uncharacterized protein n=1 Tax=Lentinus tigrinus ALCF2SS1-7 TaxID=1328758 RepID=UPI0011660E27|nr:hypothetical protein L226DRAFT_475998 [Lentinus tigrinus ALCF2SS1-7]
MVALFGLSTKGSPARTTRNPDIATPPPPYSQDHSDPAVFATETTTTTTTHVVNVTTTQTTTHFFSLPLWRRRGTPAYSPKNIAAMSTDELGVMGTPAGHALNPPTLHTRDKDLPPTPNASPPMLTPPNRLSPDVSQQESDDPTRHARKQAESRSGVASVASSRASSLQPGSRSSYAPGESPSASQPTVVLARAALGLGLPHGAPTVSASSSSSEVNTVSLFPPQSPIMSEARAPSLTIRHAKSFHREPQRVADEAPPSAIRERRRTRGLSLGPLSLMSSDTKGKQRETDIDANASDQKPLSRKSSFWSRRRVNSRPDPALAPPSPTPQPTLPVFPPVSPFYINTPVPSPGLSANHPSELQRRHSERTRKQSLRKDDERRLPDQSPPLPPSIHTRRRRGSQRPQTADSASSPRLSFFADPRPFVASPASSPLPTPQEQPAPPPPPSQPEPRSRAQTNPPLLHRLSVNLFGGSSSNSHTPTSSGSPNILDGQGLTSPPSSLGSSRPSLSKPSVEIPRPRADEESPEGYLQRLVEAVSKAEVATVLASSPDAFHARALHVFIERFNFVGDPLDVAVRKLLMDVGLPRETQQIDRVIEAFAARYVQCNPNLFASDDHPYILAFSLIMLHTDAFNKSNKRKMTKPDYIKNTRLPGVAPEVLDCFYDNIVFAPFIFIEDPLDVNGQRGLVPEAISRRMSTINMASPGGLNGSGSTLLGKSNKIDPYYLITRNLLDDLRVDVYALVPAESPYFYQGTAGPWNEDELQRAFALATMVEVGGLDHRYLASPFFSMSVSGGPGPMFQSSLGSLPPLTQGSGGMFVIKVTKVGLLLRKEDIMEGGRRALSRKWREWCVLLTGSQLLFFRDTSWAGTIQAQAERSNGQVVLPQTSLPQPDEMFSVRDTIAVFDKSYTKYAHTLRLVMPDGRHFLLQAQDEREMNEWIARINYASAFKTAGVRMRSLGLSSRDIELTGIAAAASHLKDVKHNLGKASSPVIRTWNGRLSEDLDIVSRGAGDSEPTLPPNATSTGGSRARPNTAGSIGSDPSTPPYENSSRLFKATFDEVKTELATGKWRSLDEMSIRSTRKRAYSLESVLGSPGFPPAGRSTDDAKPRLSSRPEIIKSKVEDLNSKIALARNQLDTDMRFVRNLAVLTPFQRATRDRVQAAVQNVAKRVMQVRLDIEKLVCHRDVLTADLAAEERDWQWTKKLAMRAATQKIASQREHDRVVEREAERAQEAERARLPKLTLSAYVDQTEAQPASSSPVNIPRTAKSAHPRPDSSVADSFHSAASGASSAWHGRQRSATVTLSSPHSSATTPIERGSYTASDTSFPSLESPERQRAAPLAAQNSMDSTATTEEGGTHEKFYTAPEMPEEQAEEWNKTRAAKRVSLVKLPSDLRMSILFGKHAREETSTPELSEDTAATPTSTSSPSPARRRSVSPYDQHPGGTVAMLDLQGSRRSGLGQRDDAG